MASISNQVQTALIHGAESCDASASILLCVLCLVGLVVTFFGYRIYILALGLFAFLLAFAAEAAVGASWIAMAPGQQDAVKKVIVVVFCLLWGTIGAVICRKLAGFLDKFLGFVLGAAVGVVLVAAVIYVVEAPVSHAIGEEYLGWDQFATVTLGVPVALLSGYLCRNSIKYLLMLASALMGAVVAVRSLETVLVCAEVDMETVKPYITAIIVAVITLLGFVTQLYCQPAQSAKRVDACVVGAAERV